MCFILVYLMSIQMRTVNKTDLTSIKVQGEADLRSELSNWKTKYEEINLKYQDLILKIEEYKDTSEGNVEARDLLNKEIAHANLLLGKTDIQGPGVIITLTDAEEMDVDEKGRIKDYDLYDLINELRMAGAESISINDQRIINMSDVRTVGNHIVINSAVSTVPIISPYTIKAIGDSGYLTSQLNIKGGYIDVLKMDGIGAVVDTQENIVIPKYNGETTFKYAT